MAEATSDLPVSLYWFGHDREEGLISGEDDTMDPQTVDCSGHGLEPGETEVGKSGGRDDPSRAVDEVGGGGADEVAGNDLPRVEARREK